MATKQPLASGGLFQTADEAYGWIPAELDTNLITRKSGSHQFLGGDANHHDDQSTVGPGGNRVQAGQLPRTQSGPVGSPEPCAPLGTSTSLNG